MTTLAATLGCLLLLANPQPKEMVAASFLQSQESAPAQNPPEQPPATTEPAPDPTQTPDKTEPSAPDTAKPAPVTPTKTTKNSAAKKPAKKRSPPNESSIVVVRNGGSSDTQGQISYSATDQQTLEKRKHTDALLTATTTNLKQITGKQLNLSQQDMVKQIHNYMAQSKNASKTGDIQGANNLAVKAHLLSEELVKP
jgi:outer membrane biosynthesis protein TonB